MICTQRKIPESCSLNKEFILEKLYKIFITCEN